MTFWSMENGSSIIGMTLNFLRRLEGEMDKDQDRRIKAIQGSIRKWVDIAYFDAIDYGTEDCELCGVFKTIIDCGNCPVFKATGRPMCHNTPYINWCKHQWSEYAMPGESVYRHVRCPECVKLAEDEIEFLESVLERELKEVTDANP
jgi:hypothetical protein